MEISRTISRTLAINLTPQRYTVQFTGPTSLRSTTSASEAGRVVPLGPIPQVHLDFLKSDSGTKVVAKPELRVTEGEKANLHLGDFGPPSPRRPSTPRAPSGATWCRSPPSRTRRSHRHRDRPRVHHNRGGHAQADVEVSQLGDQVSTGNGQSSPSSTRARINTVIRLKDERPTSWPG